MTQPVITIVIVDDHEMVRHGLRTLLSLELDFRIVGEAGNIAEAVPLVERVRPHVILLDMKLPDSSGLDACRRLLAVAPDVRILVLSSYLDEATVVGAVQSGAQGYALKDVRTQDLVLAIRAVASGRGYLDPRITQQALRWIRTQPETGDARRLHPSLSPQERLIMPLLAQGRTNKEIATALHLSDKTVKNYLAHIFEKLQVKRRAEAVAWYVRETPPASAK